MADTSMDGITGLDAEEEVSNKFAISNVCSDLVMMSEMMNSSYFWIFEHFYYMLVQMVILVNKIKSW
ncbi:hypothetical protein RIR_jg15752.t1 [Rhizophagus irregularis DAOM 181602=DAOM 197198]|uniref:Uncharacterized protein n=1 Tax=Rhizophagus irregularis (strain DAOM 197198w) TaxID=1432141 RepID=A0A015KBR3_RHIIW|nr:hypothetical protein RirG_007960 [Rhizophagus irregularis DAOM 197198w]GBC44678.2 hypothetical protein RIR_jg15752.t1 [Rhizophagus irregularis DAOM 181602=DAOM 197198]